MLISETRYRYQVESDIASFRDILLGLFFISIGMMLNLDVLIEYYLIIFLIFFMYTIFKVTVITFLARLFKYELGVGIRAGVILGQAGEFSFVILALGQEQGLISGDILQIILSVCLLSMLFASLIIPFNGRIARYISKEYLRNSEKIVNKIEASSEDFNDHVIICGYGRGGQYLGRFLKEENISFIAIDMDLNRVNDAANAGEKVMYGDASRRVVLRAAGIERAKALVIAYSDDRSSLKVLNVIRDIYPDLPVIVRTRDESSIQQLQDAGATDVVPEVLESSLMLASHALVLLDVPLARVIKKIRAFRNERYKIFRGYFMGSSEASDDMQGQDQLQLHSIEVKNNFYLLNKYINEIPFDRFNTEIQHLRRPNMLEDIEARSDIKLKDGDVIVILGLPRDLIEFEKFTITVE
jgi:CPA2 family monovalent cation:H+ antiporter-2